MVERSVNASSKYVRAYVHAYLSDNIEAARTRIAGYGKMYSDIMQGALHMKTRSELACLMFDAMHVMYLRPCSLCY